MKAQMKTHIESLYLFNFFQGFKWKRNIQIGTSASSSSPLVDSRHIHGLISSQTSKILIRASAADIKSMTPNGAQPTMHFSPY